MSREGSKIEVGGDLEPSRGTPWSRWLLFFILTALPIAALYYQMTTIQKQNAEMVKENQRLWKALGTVKASPERRDVEDKPQVQASTAYIRWGRTQCPADAKLVYKGYTAGSWFSDKGGSSAYLCLPEQPQWGAYKEGLQQGSYLHATEYQLQDYEDMNLLLTTNNGGNSLHDQDAPCVMCQVDGKSMSRTFPAMRDCPAGWTREYHGYLMAQSWNEGPNGPVCVDEAPEGIPGGEGNTNGATLYHMEFKCDTLPCPPYEQAREAICAVCTY